MPIWLRRLTYKRIDAFYKKQQEAQEEAKKTLSLTSSKRQQKLKPDINPSYVSKTAKK